MCPNLSECRLEFPEAKALPDSVQVADRWHLMENASRAFLDAVRKSMRQVRKTLGATCINPKLLTSAERLQYEGYLRREQTNAAIMALSNDGVTNKEIVVIVSSWSNGQTEGQITKLKLVKRQLYGRGKLDLLQARLIGATWENRTKYALEPTMRA